MRRTFTVYYQCESFFDLSTGRVYYRNWLITGTGGDSVSHVNPDPYEVLDTVSVGIHSNDDATHMWDVHYNINTYVLIAGNLYKIWISDNYVHGNDYYYISDIY